MLTKNNFAGADWNTLRDTPHLVGFATLLSGASGLGTVKESIAIAQGIIEGQTSSIPLIRDLSNRAEIQAAQESLRSTLGGLEANVPKERLRSLALERVGAATSLLDSAGGSQEETTAYRQWLYGLAEKVAKAAKEGGFLGIGGTWVSEEEQAFLAELRTALQLPAATV